MSERIGRRRFIALTSLSLAGLAAGCQAPAPASPTAAPKAAAPAPPSTVALPTSAVPTAAPAAPAAAAVTAPATSGGQLAVVRLATNSRVLTPGTAYTWIGDYLGYYKEEGLKLEVVTTDGSAQAIQLMLSGGIDVANGIQDPVLIQASQGNRLPLKMVYNYLRGIIYQIGVPASSPIRTIKDLQGKKIGVLSMAHPGVNYARIVVKDAGLDPERDVSLIAVGQGATAGAALQSGSVDALALWDIEYANLDNLGFALRLIEQPPVIKKVNAGHARAVSEEFLKSNRRTVVGAMRALSKSVAFQLENTPAAVQIHYKMYPETLPKGKSFEETIKEQVRLVEAQNPKLRKELDSTGKWGRFDKAAWDGYVEFLGLTGKVNPADLYTNELIEEINQFDEAAIKKQAREFKLP